MNECTAPGEGLQTVRPDLESVPVHAGDAESSPPLPLRERPTLRLPPLSFPHASSSFLRALVGICVLWTHLLMIQIVPILCAQAKVRGDGKVM